MVNGFGFRAIFSTVCLFLICSLALADLLKSPAAVSNEKGSVVATDENGKERWSADWTMEPWTEEGRPAVRFTETGSGLYSPFTKPVHWSLSAVWSADGAFKPLHFEKTFTNTQNQPIETDKKDFDPAKRSVQFVRKSAGEPPETRTVAVPSDTITVEGMAGVLRSIPFWEKKPFPFHMFTNDMKVWSLSLEARGREMVHTPAGDFECYKLEMVPHVGMLDVFRKFFPKSHIWFTVAPPHFWVKYEGLENGLGSPTIVMLLKTYEPNAR
jgi:hypothetical protein